MSDPKGDNHMSQLLLKLVWDIPMRPEENDTGLQQLLKHGLVDEDFVRESELLRRKQDPGILVVMPNIETTETNQGPGANITSNPSNSMGPPQGLEESFEERMLRQRRREAMVIGEEGRPFDLAGISAPLIEIPDRGIDTEVAES